jgi:hypothetical protein
MALRRGSSEWLGVLLDYFDKFQDEYKPFWETVDELYRPRKFERQQSLSYSQVIDQVQPGYVHAFVHGIESMVLAQNPKLFVQGWPARFDESVVPHLQDIMHRDWTLAGRMSPEMRLVVRDTIKKGVGAIESSVAFDDEDDDGDVFEAGDDDEILRQIKAEIKAQDAAIEAGKPPPQARWSYDHDRRSMVGNILTKFIPIENYVGDPDATCNEDRMWSGKVFYADLDRMRMDKTLRNVGRLKRTHVPDGVMSGYGDEEQPVNLVLLYLIHYRTGDTFRQVLFAREPGVILKKRDDPYWIGDPTRTLSWNTDGRSIFGQSDILPVSSQIAQLHLLYTKITDAYARQSEKTTFYDKGANVPNETMQAIIDPAGRKFVPIQRATGMPLSALFHEQNPPNLSSDAINLIMLLERSVQQGSGFSPSQMGQVMKSDTSAQEAAQLKAGSDLRNLHKFEAVEDFISAVAQQRLGLMAQFYDEEKIARIGGVDAARAWARLEWTREDVEHGLNVRVEPGTTRPINDDVRIEQLVNILRLVAQDPGASVMIDREELYRRLFKHMGFHDSGNLVRNKEEVAEIVAQAQAQAQAQQQAQPQPQGAQA